MSGLVVVIAWVLGGTLGARVLYRGFHAGWFTLRKRPLDVRIDPEWRVDREREERLKAAAIWRGYKR